MITTKKAANAVGGKTARACDSCLCKRARWYCPADDACLCPGCDSAVHSANQLARRHERVRLDKASSSKANGSSIVEKHCPPAWPQGFTRKARTPRHNKLASPAVQPPPPPKEEKIKNPLPLVPEIGTEEGPHEENEDQLLYRVPVFDMSSETAMGGVDEACGLDNFHGFLPSDVDLADFAADVESLLGTGLDEEMELGLGLMSEYCKEELQDGVNTLSHEGRKVVKVESDTSFDLARETMNWNFDSEAVEEEEKIVGEGRRELMNGGCKEEVEGKRFLRLNYEGVITAWASQGSPWTTGIRPEFNPNDCWLDFMGFCPAGSSHPCMGIGGDGGREARVSRYREKRRTRLFSKKIRYEVRKLNAEKRPRMKGRFVKRSSFAAGHNFPYLMNK